MKLCLISDTHNYHNMLGELEPGDILLHAGDMTGIGQPENVKRFFKWFSEQPYPHKVVIPGNHDITFDEYPDTVMDLVPHNVHLLNQSMVDLEDLKIWGEPRTPTFGHGWAYNVDRKDSQKHWDLVPDDIDILVTHGPPYGHCDKVLRPEGLRVGCKHMASFIENHPTLKLVVCGHIHEARGESMIGDVRIINASNIAPDFSHMRPPIYIEL